MNTGRNNGTGTGLGSSGKDDDTPFDGSGLRLKSIKTRRELNEVEFASILRVTEKYLLTKPSRKIAPFNFDWLLGLHREMFGSIWSWAGEIRATEKNIGVSPNIIARKNKAFYSIKRTWNGSCISQQLAQIEFLREPNSFQKVSPHSLSTAEL